MTLLEQIEAEVAADPESVGLILHGSRAAGVERPESDYDVIRVLTEAGYEARAAADDFRKLFEAEGSLSVDVAYTSIGRLRALVDAPDWRVGMLVTGRVLVDRAGELDALVAEIVRRAGEHALGQLGEHYDDYLNCFVRSLKAWRRGDELGARMQAAESCLRPGRWVRRPAALEREGAAGLAWDRPRVRTRGRPGAAQAAPLRLKTSTESARFRCTLVMGESVPSRTCCSTSSCLSGVRPASSPEARSAWAAATR